MTTCFPSSGRLGGEMTRSWSSTGSLTAGSSPSGRSTGGPNHSELTTSSSTSPAWRSPSSRLSASTRFPGKGLQQAKNYAQLLDVPFAFSTNGKGIVEDDRNTGIETDNLTASRRQRSLGPVPGVEGDRR